MALRPGIYTPEEATTTETVDGADVGLPVFYGIASRGPVNRPILVSSREEWLRIFGNPTTDESAFYAIKGYFANGGSRAYFVRLAHYANITDASTLTGAPASFTVDSLDMDGPATFEAPSAFSAFALPISGGVGSETLVFNINDLGDQTATFDGASAFVTGSGGVFTDPLPASTDFDVRFDGGPVQTVDLSGEDIADLDELFAKLNVRLVGGFAFDSGSGQIRLASDTVGTSSSVQVTRVSANAGTQLGLSAAGAATTGTGSVGNMQSVTFADVKAVIEEDIKHTVAGDLLTVTMTVDGKLFLTNVDDSEPYGPAHTIDLKSGSAELIAALGLGGLGTQGGGSAATGVDAAVAACLKFEAGYLGTLSPGLDGNMLDVEVSANPRHPSQGAGNDLAANITAGDTLVYLTSLSGLEAESTLYFVGGGRQEAARVLSVETEVSGTTVLYKATLAAPVSNAYASASALVFSVEHDIKVYYNEVLVEVWPQLSPNPLSGSYYETVINDESLGSTRIVVTHLNTALIPRLTTGPQDLASGTSELVGFTTTDVLGDSSEKTGLYAADTVKGFDGVALCVSLSTVSPRIPASAVLAAALSDYGKARDAFAVLCTPAGLNETAARAYRNNTLGLDTDHAALYYPWVWTSDPFGQGVNPKKLVPNVGHIVGLYARVDGMRSRTRDGGPATAPAGDGEYGQLRDVVALERQVGDADHGTLNEAGVNVVANIGDRGRFIPAVQGARTLSSVLKRRYVQVRRYKNYAMRSVKAGLRWAVFRNNDFRLWGRMTDRLRDFFEDEWLHGQLRGETLDQAISIQIDATTTTQTDVDNGVVNGRIGPAYQRPAEFVYMTFTQDRDSGEITFQELD